MQSLNRRLEPLLSIKKHGIHAKQLWSALKLKLILVIMLAFNLQTQAKAFAQHLSIDMKNADLRAVFKQIKAQTGYDFFYNESMTKHARPVTLRVKNQPLKTVLDLCFRDQPFTYAVVKKLIVVKNKTIPPEENEPPAAVKPAVRFLEIEGTVSDSTGVALSGVSVLNSKTRRGTFTNPQGHYVIAATAGDVLEFSYIGYDTKSVTVADETQIDIQLVQSTSTLSDLIVVGYGTQKKEDLTGAVSVLKSEQLENRPVTSVGNALQGTMPGVAVTSAVTGQPGNDAGTIRVRGVGTLNNSDAMVVVDGVISSMNNVNPDDIASISVLKDAASAAIYGSRAANGVILITTKRGKNAAPKISYSGYLGKQSATALPDFLPSWQAASLYNQALKNEGKQARWTDEEVQKFKSGSDPYNFPNTDWLGLFYKGSGIQQNHYVSVTGGNDNTQYAFSAGLFDQKGIVDKTEAKRYTTRFNINTTLSQHLTASGSLAFTYSGKGEPSNPYTSEFTQLVRQINRISPIIPYKFENGNYGHISDGNPMAWLEGKSFAAYKNYDLVANGGLDWEITKGLHFKPSIAYVMGALHEKHFTADQQYYNVDGSPSFYQGPNSVKDVNHFNNVVTFQDLLEYTKAFGDHHFKALGGYSQEYTKFTYDDGFRKGLLNNDLSDINLGSTDGQTTSGYTYDLGLRSFFGRINYDFDNKYLFEANIRYDGSSRFAPDKRWFVFPSFSAGWNLDKETFFESLKPVFSSLKLRGSWGKLGNQNVVVSGGTIDQTYYPYIPVIATGQNYTFGGTAPDIASGIAPITGANPILIWESTRESGAGLDAGLLQGKMNVTIDYFDKRTTGILLAVPVGAPYGLKSPVQNAATMSNKGWEFSVGYNDKKGDFTYYGSLNATFINNKITDLHGTGPNISGYTVQQVGSPYGALYGYVAQGLFQSADQVKNHAYQSVKTGPGDIIYKDLDGNDTINSADRQYLGNSYPKITFGMNLGASWRNFDLSVLLQGAAGVKAYMDLGKLGGVSPDANKPTSALLDNWTVDNPNASFPRLWYANHQNDPSNTPSSFWVKNGAYLRVKNLQIGYTLPESLTKRMGITRLRIYYSGQNILTFDSLYKWVDPEEATTSSIYYYPQVKVNTIGLNVTF